MDKIPKFIRQVGVAGATALAALTSSSAEVQAQHKTESSQPATTGLENLSQETKENLKTFGIEVVESGDTFVFLTHYLRYLGSQQLLSNFESRISSLSSFTLFPGDMMEATTKYNEFLGRDILEIKIQKKDNTLEFHRFTIRN